MLIGQLDPLTEQQLVGIYRLQQSTQQAEEALSQGQEQLQQSLIETIAAAGPVIDGMQQMAIALAKLSNLESFVRQVRTHVIIKLKCMYVLYASIFTNNLLTGWTCLP